MLNPFANRKVLKRGERAQARIVEMTAPDHGAEPSNVEMTLEINFRGVPFQVCDRWMVAGTEPLGVGSVIWVAVDPEKRQRVAIDWDRTRADYRERTDVRSQVLGSGIPVPLPRVRDALEAAEAKEAKWALESESEPEPEVAQVGALSLHERELLAQHGGAPLAMPPVKGPIAAVPEPVPAPAAQTRRWPVREAPLVRPASDDDDLTSKLERLAALHAAGSLTDGEFSAAKAHVLSALL